MKKKMTLALALLLMFPMATYADEKEATKAESTATVGFVAEEPTEPVKPLDPTDPEKELQPEGEGTGNVGPLTIDYVPNLGFGSQTITRKPETIKSTNTKPFVQVTDVRGSGAGWRLQAGLSEFVNTDANHTISDAKIVMTNGEVVTNDTKNNKAPVANQNIELKSNSEIQYVDITTAQKDHGMGTWLTSWLAAGSTNEKVNLNVDTRDARVGDYEATITWNLIQTP